MADIFISYKREERPTALKLATALEKAGWTAWWDLELVGGEHFDDTIQAELDEARCVVVLWSKRSVKSNFVKDEATYALDQGKLLPARIDDANVPLRFHRLHTVYLVGWSGAKDAVEFKELVAQITKRIGAPSQIEQERPPGAVFQDTLKDGTKGPEMVVIPAGSFLMGSPESEEGRRDNEGPQHQVTFAKPFAMGKYTVTFAEYDQYCALTDRDPPNDEGWGRENRPVINVSWDDAVAYCRFLSAQTGKRYRLPSEAEWEYAARAGTTTVYWWGNEVGKNRANCDGCGSEWDKKQTAPVGSFEANAFGLHDMLGNVYERVQDCRHKDYTDAPADGLAWEAGGDSSWRMIRGGSWSDAPGYMRSAYRSGGTPDARNVGFGFRLARDL